MNREQIISMAREAGLVKVEDCCGVPNKFCASDEWKGNLAVFANLVASAEREKVATWMMQCGYATGHGDTIEDLLKELDWQAKEIERSMCVQIVEDEAMQYAEPVWAFEIVNDIKARGSHD